MRSAIDFASWQSVATSLLGLALVTLIMVGLRLVVMQTVQRRRERENRQINERLRTLIAAYKTLGGSFTGDLPVDPAHLRTQTLESRESRDGEGNISITVKGERRRRIRDNVEASLSDVILLGNTEHVRLAVAAANDLVAGRKVETGELVVSLRNFIREALDLEPLPELAIPMQGPTRPVAGGGRGGGRGPRGEVDRSGGGGRSGGAAGGGQSVGGGGASAGLLIDHSSDQRS
ncbi:hypothetical protein [Caenimonas koreensis]|uniref:hypothetical protein n=1 Tax=Caenimonas koreensis TaxID=367474 RepID=UPI003784CA87